MRSAEKGAYLPSGSRVRYALYGGADVATRLCCTRTSAWVSTGPRQPGGARGLSPKGLASPGRGGAGRGRRARWQNIAVSDGRAWHPGGRRRGAQQEKLLCVQVIRAYLPALQGGARPKLNTRESSAHSDRTALPHSNAGKPHSTPPRKAHLTRRWERRHP